MTDAVYCPFCQRDIEPECDEFGDIIETPGGGWIYVHDDVEHDEDYNPGDLQ